MDKASVEHLKDEDKQELAQDVKAAFMELEYDVALRNTYMNKRDRYIYGEGLWETLTIPDGFDKTLYNYLRRAIDIHVAQFAGKPYQIYSYYDKEDLSLISTRDDLDEKTKSQQLKLAELRNKKSKANAEQRRKLLESVKRDNGGASLFARGARIGSAYGETIYKQWPNFKDKKVMRTVIETPQNYRAGWTDTDFRDRDWDGYVYQISEMQAKRKYGKHLPDGMEFETSYLGLPFMITGSDTSDPLDQRATRSNIPQQTQRKMVSVIDFTGYLPQWGKKDKNLEEVAHGDESRFSTLIVGGHVVEVIIDEDKLPKYYRIPNQEVPQRAWGESDLPESALQINATLIERMSDWITIANKTLFPLIMAKGFEEGTVPAKNQRQMKVAAMDSDQHLEVVTMPNAFGQDYGMMVTKLEEAFIRVVGIGRLLWDDPMQANSNQALMTTMRGIIDIVNGKQKLWEPVMLEMEKDALTLIGKIIPNLKEVVDEDQFLYIVWPSIQHREDAAYQQMWLNLFHAGTISLDTFLMKTTDVDTEEEIDRLRDNMTDPLTASVLGHQLGEMAHFALFKSMGIPPWGYVVPKISIKGDLSPQQEGNIAQNYGWNDGPFGSAMGPQGTEGIRADDNFMNQGMIQGQDEKANLARYGMPASVTPGQPLQGQQPGQPPTMNTAPAPQGAPQNQMGMPHPSMPVQPGLPGHPMPGAPAGAGQVMGMAAAQGAMAPVPHPNMPNSILTPSQNTGQSASMPGSGAPAISAAGAIAKHHQNSGR